MNNQRGKKKLAQGVSCFWFGHRNRPYFLLFNEYNILLFFFFFFFVVIVIVSINIDAFWDYNWFEIALNLLYRAIFNF